MISISSQALRRRQSRYAVMVLPYLRLSVDRRFESSTSYMTPWQKEFKVAPPSGQRLKEALKCWPPKVPFISVSANFSLYLLRNPKSLLSRHLQLFLRGLRRPR